MAKPVPLELSGIASISRRPERGVVSIEASHKGEVQADVSREVQEAALAIQNQLRPLADRNFGMGESELPAVLRWSSDAMLSRYTTETYWVDKYGNVVSDPSWSSRDQSNQSPATENRGIVKKTIKTYYASINMVVRFRDFAKLSEFTTGLATHPLVQVTQVAWMLTEETKKELRGEAIKEAYKEAYEKAAAFAEAMGGKVVRPVAIKPRGQEAMFNGAAVAGGGFRRWQAGPMGGAGGPSPFANLAPSMQMQQQQQAMTHDRQGENGEFALTFVPQDVSFSSEWDIKFELE